jgi:pimeloyl-ACP methyl ester carboxylesterase
MSAFADFFRRRGMRVVLLDLPAHGLSPGRRTSLIDCARAVCDVARDLGPIRLAVGHSIGALAALVAGGGRLPMPRGAGFAAYVLVAMPDRFMDVTRAFGTEQGLGPSAQRMFERRLERLALRSVADFTGTRLLAEAGRPALIVHARDDAEVPFQDAERIATSSPAAELAVFDGLGHRAILYAPQAVRTAHAFLARHAEPGASNT